MTTLLSFANETLLLTNLFLQVYKILLEFLNFFFPPGLNPNFFSKKWFSPEPFEIPLYLILSIIWVIIIFTRSFTFMTGRTNRQRWIIFFALLLPFFLNIGSYPLKNNLPFIKPPVDSISLILIVAAYIFTIITVVIIAYRLRFRPLLLTLLILITIALFTFEPGFPLSTHDFSYFLGPIYEVAHAKTIFSTTSSQYGFLSILILGFLTRVNLFNPFYLPFLTWILYILQYFLCFYIIHKSSRSIILALIGLFSILTINYFSLYHLPNTMPQVGPMRWLPLIVSLFLIQRYKNITDSGLVFWLALLSIWNVEAGIALFLSYFFTLFMLKAVRAIGTKKILSSLFFFFVYILTILIILDIIHVLSGRQMIDFIGAFTRLREFAVAGIAMIPMPWRTHFWIVLLIYFATIIYVFRNELYKINCGISVDQKSEDTSMNIGKVGVTSEVTLREADCGFLAEPRRREGITSDRIYFAKRRYQAFLDGNHLLLFSANLSLFASVYFVGRSHPHNLFHISIFAILNVFLLISQILKNTFHKYISRKIIFIFYFFLFIFFVVYPVYNRKQALASMIKTKFDRLKNPSIFKPELEQQIKQYYLPESLLLKKNLPEEEILILSVDDTYLFYLSDKKNLLLDNPQSGIATASKADLKMALKIALKACPQKIAANCSLFGLCPQYPTFNYEAEVINIQKILLESLEKGCKVKYKPIKCTTKLCIAART